MQASEGGDCGKQSARPGYYSIPAPPEISLATVKKAAPFILTPLNTPSLCILGLREYPHKQKNNSISSIVHPSRVLSFPIILHYCLICTDDDLKSHVVSPCLFSFLLVFF